MALVTIATYMNLHEAELAKAHLEGAGIEAEIADEGIVGANPLLANAVGGVKLQVSEDRAEDAEAALDEMDKAEVSDDACLSCGKPMGAASKCPACGWSYEATE
jgi:hypothetical protein